MPYKLRNKDAIGGRGWNIATQERKIGDVEIEIVTFHPSFCGKAFSSNQLTLMRRGKTKFATIK